MAKILRKLISRLNGQVMSRMSAERRDLQVPINVSIEPNKNTGSLVRRTEGLSIGGETKDLSETGLAFFVDAIRLREHYLVGEDRVLVVKLDLPNGTIKLKAMGKRYEQVDVHSTHSRYLIGAAIVEMDAVDREVYTEFLRLGNKAFKQNAPSFQTNIGN